MIRKRQASQLHNSTLQSNVNTFSLAVINWKSTVIHIDSMMHWHLKNQMLTQVSSKWNDEFGIFIKII